MARAGEPALGGSYDAWAPTARRSVCTLRIPALSGRAGSTQGAEVRKNRRPAVPEQCREFRRLQVDIARKVLVPLGAVARPDLQGNDGEFPFYLVRIERRLQILVLDSLSASAMASSSAKIVPDPML